MADVVDIAEVWLWGRQIGAVHWDTETNLATFEYTPEFLRSGIQLAPLTMPLGSGLWRFPELSPTTYAGLPGMLADSLPDTWGSALIRRWLRDQGRDPASFTPVERLSYIGSRGIGALEYRPALRRPTQTTRLVVDELADLAARVLADRSEIQTDLSDEGLEELYQVGTSAGGARAKAVIAWNRDTGDIRSGQSDVPEGFTHWILKFDGVGSSDRDLTDPQGYGRVEYAYNQMANDAGLSVPEARLQTDGSGRAHFMIRRFDRTESGERVHVQTLAAIAHYDYNIAGAYGYEDAMTVLHAIGAPAVDLEEQFRRMVFNVVARNQDDHTKNISYTMDKTGVWRLAPAYDVIWAYNPSGQWTGRHQMTINGKRDDFHLRDLETVGRQFGIRSPRRIVKQVIEVVSEWTRYATEAGVPTALATRIGTTLRLDL